MNRERDAEHALRSWIEEGAELAPERFVWSALEAIETTPQRGAWQASLEGLIMKLKSAAPVLGVAAAVVIAVAAFQLGARIGGPTTPSPAPRLFTRADLPGIVLTDANAPAGLEVDGNEFGVVALMAPMKEGGPTIDQSAFIDARMTNVNSTDTGGYVTWSALFETAADAEVAFDFLISEHGSGGWDMTRSSISPSLGDESVTYTGAAYSWNPVIVDIWRVDNLLLAAVAMGDVANDAGSEDRLLGIAELMDGRAH